VFNLKAQDTVVVFKDYASFVNNSGETYNRMVGYSNKIVKTTIHLKKDSVESKIKCKDIWGFTYNGVLFRTDERTGQMARLVSIGKICYYENGIGHLIMMRDKTTKEEFYWGYYCYVSKSLNSTMAPFPSPEVQVSDAHKQIRRFRKANPEYEKLFISMNKYYNYTNVRDRVFDFEKN
jgi:hypothetical protein